MLDMQSELPERRPMRLEESQPTLEWLKPKWRVIAGGALALLALALYIAGILSAEEAFGVALAGAVFGGFSQALVAHRTQIFAALDQYKAWHEQRDRVRAELVQGVASPLLEPGEPMVPVSVVAATVASALRNQAQINSFEKAARSDV